MIDDSGGLTRQVLFWTDGRGPGGRLGMGGMVLRQRYQRGGSNLPFLDRIGRGPHSQFGERRCHLRFLSFRARSRASERAYSYKNTEKGRAAQGRSKIQKTSFKSYRTAYDGNIRHGLISLMPLRQRTECGSPAPCSSLPVEVSIRVTQQESWKDQRLNRAGAFNIPPHWSRSWRGEVGREGVE